MESVCRRPIRSKGTNKLSIVYKKQMKQQESKIETILKPPLSKPNFTSLFYKVQSEETHHTLGKLIEDLKNNLKCSEFCIANIEDCSTKFSILLPIELIKNMPDTCFFNMLTIQNGTDDEDDCEDFKIFFKVFVFAKEFIATKTYKTNLILKTIIQEEKPTPEDINKYMSTVEETLLTHIK